MEKYENMDNFHERTHILEVTLQCGKHKGTFQAKLGGNTFGSSILNFFDEFEDMQEYVETIVKNDCKLTFIDDDWFTCILADKDGNQCEIEMEMEELGGMVVKLEIVGCTIDE